VRTLLKPACLLCRMMLKLRNVCWWSDELMTRNAYQAPATLHEARYSCRCNSVLGAATRRDDSVCERRALLYRTGLHLPNSSGAGGRVYIFRPDTAMSAVFAQKCRIVQTRNLLVSQVSKGARRDLVRATCSGNTTEPLLAPRSFVHSC
jgi:hypothetical protein